MPGRKYPAAGGLYRYGFNGKENDNEVKGKGNQQDYGMRIYNPRLVRFLSVDPITKEYPELTPYQFASNNPIRSIDLDGMEGWELSTPAANLKRDTEAKQAMLNKPQVRDIEILVWNPYRNQAQIGKTSVVMANIAAARNNYNNAVAANIAGGPFGAASYMMNPAGGGFAGATVDGVVMSFGGIPGGASSIFPRSAQQGIGEVSSTEVVLSPVGLGVNTKPSSIEIPNVVNIPKSKYPQSAQHIEDATANGVAPSGVINRQNANYQRRENLKGIPTKQGLDRDEFPPAVVTPTNGVSVRHIDPSDNRGSGAHMGKQIDHLPNGTKICFRVTE